MGLHIGPVIGTTRENEFTVIMWDSDFTTEEIRLLINDIEIVRQNPKYSRVDIYYQSNGGYVKDMFALADYLNDIDDFRVNIIASGYCCSCGYWLLTLLNNPKNIKVMFTDMAKAMIHLMDVSVSVRGQLGENHNASKFVKMQTEEANKRMVKDVLPHLGLTEEQVKIIADGGDLYLGVEEFENSIEHYTNYKICKSGDVLTRWNSIEDQINQLKKDQKSLEKYYKEVIGDDLIKHETKTVTSKKRVRKATK